MGYHLRMMTTKAQKIEEGMDHKRYKASSSMEMERKSRGQEMTWIRSINQAM